MALEGGNFRTVVSYLQVFAPMSKPVFLSLAAPAPLPFPPVVLVGEARELEEPGLVPPLVSAVSDLQSPSDRLCFEMMHSVQILYGGAG